MRLIAVGLLVLLVPQATALELCSSTSPTPENCAVTKMDRHCSLKCTGDMRPVLDLDGIALKNHDGSVVLGRDSCVHELQFYVQDCSVDPATGARPRYCPPGGDHDRVNVFAKDTSKCPILFVPGQP